MSKTLIKKNNGIENSKRRRVVYFDEENPAKNGDESVIDQISNRGEILTQPSGKIV